MQNTYISLLTRLIDKYEPKSDTEYTIKDLTELFIHSELILGSEYNTELVSILIECIIILDRDYDESLICDNTSDIILDLMEYVLDEDSPFIGDSSKYLVSVKSLLDKGFHRKLRKIMPNDQYEMPYEWRYLGNRISLVNIVINDVIELDTIL